jgi:hypothetical protein
MDKLVKRVTVVHGAGDDRERTIVYEDEDESLDDEARWRTSPGLHPKAARRNMMDKLVKRVTVVHGTGDRTVVYEDRDERLDEEIRRRTSPWLRPIESVVRQLLKADLVGAQEAYQRFLDSGRRRKNGWLLDAPRNVVKSSRKAYNEGRKGVLVGLLPKAD